jgi:hypothetical protein
VARPSAFRVHETATTAADASEEGTDPAAPHTGSGHASRRDRDGGRPPARAERPATGAERPSRPLLNGRRADAERTLPGSLGLVRVNADNALLVL